MDDVAARGPDLAEGRRGKPESPSGKRLKKYFFPTFVCVLFPCELFVEQLARIFRLRVL